MDSLSRFRVVAAEALRAQDAMLAYWRDSTPNDFSDATADDVELLCRMISLRIYPVSAFERLAHANSSQAIQALLSRYLGKGVDPDRKFGGFEFELAAMLDDLLVVAGVEGVVSLIQDDNFAEDALQDHRVQRCFADVLGIDDRDVTNWVSARMNREKGE